MRTPIADFVKEYAEKKGGRFHMPGHKGQAFLGCEALDITEIVGADALYEAEGIIAESEKNAAHLFGTARTLFSVEGSSQCIRAMMKLAQGYWQEKYQVNERPYVIATRNVHKAFIYAAALVDFDVVWIYPQEMHSLCSCHVTATQLEDELKKQIKERNGVPPMAVYVTCPDYLGGQLDVAALAEVTHRYKSIILVDNAHGAYLHFLEESQHPIDIGVDMCCDSAHKTLPVLTGGAYLQISKSAPDYFKNNAKQAMVLFGSTSPSYLILASLDLCNHYLENGYTERLMKTVKRLEEVRKELRQFGWLVENTEPLKLTIRSSASMSGIEIAKELRHVGIDCEYADKQYIVLMVTPENTATDFEKLLQTLAVKQAYAKLDAVLSPVYCEQKTTIRQAIFGMQEEVSIDASLGRICGTPTVACPPAIPIVVAGEEINEEAIRLFKYYGIETVMVVSL